MPFVLSFLNNGISCFIKLGSSFLSFLGSCSPRVYISLTAIYKYFLFVCLSKWAFLVHLQHLKFHHIQMEIPKLLVLLLIIYHSYFSCLQHLWSKTRFILSLSTFIFFLMLRSLTSSVFTGFKYERYLFNPFVTCDYLKDLVFDEMFKLVFIFLFLAKKSIFTIQVNWCSGWIKIPTLSVKTIIYIAFVLVKMNLTQLMGLASRPIDCEVPTQLCSKYKATIQEFLTVTFLLSVAPPSKRALREEIFERWEEGTD